MLLLFFFFFLFPQNILMTLLVGSQVSDHCHLDYLFTMYKYSCKVGSQLNWLNQTEVIRPDRTFPRRYLCYDSLCYL